MQKAEDILNEMESILDQLVLNAEHLHEVSQKVIAEEELTSLQTRQEQLMSSLLKLDHDFQDAATHSAQDRKTPLQNRIRKKLDLFEKLNSSFIKNIISSHGLISFEEGKNNKHKKCMVKKKMPKTRLENV